MRRGRVGAGVALLLLASAAAVPALGAPLDPVGANPVAANPVAGVPGSVLASPGDYSFAPPSILSGGLPGGMAEQSFGSNGERSTAVQLNSAVSGNTRVFVAAGAAQTPHWRDVPSVTATTVAAGVQTATPFGLLSVGVSGGQVRVPNRY